MKEIIYNASVEVSSAIVTAVSTTVVSFVPVFAMEAAEGKLFRPLAFTKTFALISALLVTLFILPTVAQWFFGVKVTKNTKGKLWNGFLILIGLVTAIWVNTWAGVTIMALAGAWFVRNFSPKKMWITENLSIIISVVSVTYLLANFWMPLGAGESLTLNFIFVGILLVIILGTFILIEHSYPKILAFCLDHKIIFLSVPFIIIMFGSSVWMGFNTTFGFVASGFESVGINIKSTKIWSGLTHSLPGLGKEFMPSLDEGSFLLMPTSMPHSGIEANLTLVKQLDMLLVNIPEVELSVGKSGRVESALDPAPISMFENLINYKSEYKVNEKGHREKFRVDDDDKFILSSGDSYTNEEMLTKHIDVSGLIADDDGRYFRNWRKEIKSPGDIWNEIVKVTKIPGLTSAPKLMPIETRLIMLQTGMRAPMGIKVFGPDLGTIEDFGLELEEILQEIPSVKAEAVFADRIVGKPYIHLDINRDAIARYGLNVEDVQMVIETAIGGIKITTTVEGRERFPVRVRYPRELRDNPDALKKIYMPTPTGAQVPLTELVDIEYYQGPQIIKSEDTFLVGYVLLDKMDGYAEVDVVEAAQIYIQNKIDEGELIVPSGLSYKFTGNYENQVRAEKRLAIIVPVVLLTIFLILYFQFKSVSTSLMVFTGIALAFSGAFLMLWLYGQDWFFNFAFFDTNMRDLFQMHTINLSVAVWVGFIALFGIATDDGVLIGTFLDQSFERSKPKTIEEVRAAVLKAGLRRIKPALMTVATTIIALLPILSSTGRGSDIMIPMAIPSFGGMCIALISIFVVPVLYSFREERKVIKAQGDSK